MIKATNNLIMTTVTSKGQITIPSKVREMLHITSKGDIVGFMPTKEGILMKHLEATEIKDEFSESEWSKLEKLVSRKGKTYKSAKNFLKAIKKL